MLNGKAHGTASARPNRLSKSRSEKTDVERERDAEFTRQQFWFLRQVAVHQPEDAAVATVLADHANRETYLMFPSIKTIARITNTSERRAGDHLRALVKSGQVIFAGWLNVGTKPGSRASVKAYRWRLWDERVKSHFDQELLGIRELVTETSEARTEKQRSSSASSRHSSSRAQDVFGSSLGHFVSATQDVSRSEVRTETSYKPSCEPSDQPSEQPSAAAAQSMTTNRLSTNQQSTRDSNIVPLRPQDDWTKDLNDTHRGLELLKIEPTSENIRYFGDSLIALRHEKERWEFDRDILPMIEKAIAADVVPRVVQTFRWFVKKAPERIAKAQRGSRSL